MTVHTREPGVNYFIAHQQQHIFFSQPNNVNYLLYTALTQEVLKQLNHVFSFCIVLNKVNTESHQLCV